MNVVFRTDASVSIGSGHAVRCLSLADELRRREATIWFVCRELPVHIGEHIEQKGYSLFRLSAEEAGTNWGRDAQETLAVLARIPEAVDWLIVDHYALDTRWERTLRSRVHRILVIDDLADRPHECDLLLDQNLYPDMEQRYRKLLPKSCRCLLGPRYALLRPDFAWARKNLSRQLGPVQRILVSFGGTDPSNETEKVLDALDRLERPQIQLHVVVGAANPHRARLESRCQASSNTVFHCQVDHMAQLMAASDLAIGGGGTASWERCCLGVPTLAWPIADNQKAVLEALGDYGGVCVPDRDSTQTISGITHHIFSLLENTHWRKILSKRSQELVDGCGAQRVARQLARLEVRLRPVRDTDCRAVFEWRNHPDTRRYALDPMPIPWEDHKRWFEHTLENSNRVLLIAETERESVGVLRFDLSANEAWVSVYVVPGLSGAGYGQAILSTGQSWLRAEHPGVKTLKATIRYGNRASHSLFTRLGFEPIAGEYAKRLET